MLASRWNQQRIRTEEGKQASMAAISPGAPSLVTEVARRMFRDSKRHPWEGWSHDRTTCVAQGSAGAGGMRGPDGRRDP